MAKKKVSGSRPPSRGGSEYDEGSVCSTGRTSGAAYDPDLDTEVLEDDPFAVAVEQLYEKRTSTREAGLASLVRLLASDRQFDECMLRVATFSQMFLGSLRRGGPGEATLAARALGLHCVTLGAGDESEGIFRDALPVLEPIVLTSKSAATRAAAADALAATAFVGAEGPQETLDAMALLARAFSKSGQAAPVVVSALRGWTLLLTTVPAWQLDSGLVEAALGALHGLLHSEDVEVRGAAGEAVALLYDTCGLTKLPESPRLPRLSASSPGLFSLARGDSSDSAGGGSGAAPASSGRPPLPPSATRNGQQCRRLELESQDVEAEEGQRPSTSTPETAAAAGAEEQQERQAAVQQQSISLPPEQRQQQQLGQQPLGEAATEPQEQEQGHASPSGGLTPLRTVRWEEGPGDARGDTPVESPAAAATNRSTSTSGGGAQAPGLEDIVARMRDLAKNRGDSQRKSKADRRELRSTFRGLMDVVEDGAVAAQKIKLRHGDMLVVDSLPGVIRLNFFRRLLAEGFQAHLQHNPLLHQVFNYQPRGEPQERLSSVEKRLFKSSSSAESKERSRQRKAERAAMTSYKSSNYLLGLEG